MNLQYLSDHTGKVTGVFIPIEEWDDIRKKLKLPDESKALHRQELLEAFEQMKLIRGGTMTRPSLADFFNELWGNPHFAISKTGKTACEEVSFAKKGIFALLESLKDNPHQRTPLGNDCFKIRLSIAIKNKGKSGGARVKICVYIPDNELYRLSIQDKAERSSLNDKKLKE